MKYVEDVSGFVELCLKNNFYLQDKRIYKT